MVSKLFDAGKVPARSDDAQVLLRRATRIWGPSLGTLTTDHIAFYDSGWIELHLRGAARGWCIDHRYGWQGWLWEVEARVAESEATLPGER